MIDENNPVSFVENEAPAAPAGTSPAPEAPEPPAAEPPADPALGTLPEPAFYEEPEHPLPDAEMPSPAGDPAAPPAGPEEPAAPGQPKKKGHKLLLGAAAVLITAVTVLLVTSIIGSRPLNLLRTGFKNSRKAIEGSASAGYADELFENGSSELTVDLSRLGEAIGFDLDARVAVKTYYHLKKDPAAALQLDATLEGKTLLNALLYADGDDVALESAQLLGKTSYGVSLKSLQKNLKGSVLDPDQNTPYSLDEDTFNALLSRKALSDDLKAYQEGLEDVRKELARTLLLSLKKNVSPTKTRETLEIGGTSVKTTAIDFELNEKQLIAVYSDLINWAQSSTKLKELLHKVLTDNAGLLEQQGITVAEQEEQIYALLADMADNAEYLTGVLTDTSLSLIFYVSRSNKQLICMKGAARLLGERYGLTLTGGPDLKAPDAVMAIVKAGEKRYSLNYSLEKNTSDEFEARMKLKEGTSVLSTASLEWDKKDGDFSLTVSDLMTLTGSLTRQKKVTTLSLKKLKLEATLLTDDLSVKDLGITLTLTQDDKLPKLPRYTDLLTMKEQSFDALTEELNENISELIGSLGLIGG